MRHYTSHTAPILAFFASLEVLGNSAAAVGAVGAGVRDLVTLPYKGLHSGPVAFGRGLGLGVSAFLGGVVKGAATPLQSFSSSLERRQVVCIWTGVWRVCCGLLMDAVSCFGSRGKLARHSIFSTVSFQHCAGPRLFSSCCSCRRNVWGAR